jgi:hypothetical protein
VALVLLPLRSLLLFNVCIMCCWKSENTKRGSGVVVKLHENLSMGSEVISGHICGDTINLLYWKVLKCLMNNALLSLRLAAGMRHDCG